MENKEVKIKLKPKQLASITAIQQKKAQLKTMFEDLNQQEGVILELVLEDVKVDGQISGAKLEEDSLILTVSEAKVAKKKAAKKKDESIA